MTAPAATDPIAALAVPPDRHVAAAVMVAEDGRYLWQIRDTKPGIAIPGFWGLFGGSIDAGETAAAAIRRELVEELGFDAPVIQPLMVSVHAIWPRAAVTRMHFFTVPFTLADLGRMVQTEGAGMDLLTPEAAAALPRVAPWDLAAVLVHARHALLGPVPRRGTDQVPASPAESRMPSGPTGPDG